MHEIHVPLALLSYLSQTPFANHHILTLLFWVVIDLGPFIPSGVRPRLSHTLREYHIQTSHDRFFTAPPAWFTMYMYLEAIYHVPLSAWMIWAIPNGTVNLLPRFPSFLPSIITTPDRLSAILVRTD